VHEGGNFTVRNLQAKAWQTIVGVTVAVAVAATPVSGALMTRAEPTERAQAQERAAFLDYVLAMADRTQDPQEVLVAASEHGWDCPLRIVYFDLLTWAAANWDEHQGQAMSTIQAASVVGALAEARAEDFCDDDDDE